MNIRKGSIEHCCCLVRVLLSKADVADTEHRPSHRGASAIRVLAIIVEVIGRQSIRGMLVREPEWEA